MGFKYPTLGLHVGQNFAIVRINKIASSLDAAKRNRGFINSEYLDFTTLHRGYLLSPLPILALTIIKIIADSQAPALIVIHKCLPEFGSLCNSYESTSLEISANLVMFRCLPEWSSIIMPQK